MNYYITMLFIDSYIFRKILDIYIYQMAAKTDFLTFLFDQAFKAHMTCFWDNSIDIWRSEHLLEKFHRMKMSKKRWIDDVKWTEDKKDVLVPNPLSISFEVRSLKIQ